MDVTECGSGQPGLAIGNPIARGLKPDDHCGPFQPWPFYDSMILWILNAIYLELKSYYGEKIKLNLFKEQEWELFKEQVFKHIFITNYW